MRIAFFSESYEPLLNGVAVSIGTLIKELRTLGHEVYVFAPKNGDYDDPGDWVVRVPSVRTWVEPDYPLPVPLSPGLVSALRDISPDVVHTHTPWVLGWVGLRLAKRLHIPVVSTNHTQYQEYAHYIPFAPRKTMRSVIINLMRQYYNQCDGVIVPSDPISKHLLEYGVIKPIHTIPTGISLDTARDEDARSSIRASLNIPLSDKVLLYVGRLAREKNIELLLRSFDLLYKDFSNARLVLVGGGPYAAECRRLASQLSCADRVVFTGAVPRSKIAPYYSIGDLFVFPSTTDTQGLVLGEALQAGLPCVAVNAGGSPVILADGIDSLLAENDAKDFSEKVRKLLNEPNIISEYSRRAVENSSRFSPYNMAASVLSVYESIVGSGT